MNAARLSWDQREALKVLLSGENVFLTGKAGTGKSFLVNEFCEQATQLGQKVLRTASTGMAACIVDGCTVDRALNLWTFAKSEYTPKFFDLNTQAINRNDIIVIDEISMIDAKKFGWIKKCIEMGESDIQLVLVGDFYQLPPVSKDAKQREGYAFLSDAWESFHFRNCVLQTIFRQTDEELVKNLNYAREGDSQCLSYFYNKSSKEEIKDAIWICGKNEVVNRMNAEALRKIEGKSHYKYGHTSQEWEKSLPTEEVLELKVGMRLMTLINHRQGKYANGSTGTLVKIEDDILTIKFDNGNLCRVGRHNFILQPKTKTSEEITFTQFPVRAAYAITSHKCQGLTFDAANIWVEKCWECGQLYVILSRVKCIDKIYFKSMFKNSDLIVSSKVESFYDEITRKEEIKYE